MSSVAQTNFVLDGRFARELAEMSIPWQAEEAPDPRLLVLNEPLATELGLDPTSLRTPEGLLLLIGNSVPEGATPVAQAYAGHQFGGTAPVWATDGHSCSVRWWTSTAGSATSTSKAPAAHRSPAAVTDWQQSVRCCASTLSVRQ